MKLIDALKQISLKFKEYADTKLPKNLGADKKGQNVVVDENGDIITDGTITLDISSAANGISSMMQNARLDSPNDSQQTQTITNIPINRNLFIGLDGNMKPGISIKLVEQNNIVINFNAYAAYANQTKIEYTGFACSYAGISLADTMIAAIYICEEEDPNYVTLELTVDFNAIFPTEGRPGLVYPKFISEETTENYADYTVDVGVTENGALLVPTYPTLESLNAEHKVCEVHIDFIDGVYRSDTTWATIRSHVGSCYLYYNDREYRCVGPSPTDMQAHYFVYEGNLVRDCFTINRSDDVTREETIITPSSDTYGGIKADEVSDGYNVPAKFNSEDGKLYIPTYPTLESLKAKPRDFIVTVTYNDSSYASDKTFDEIKEAYDSGRDCYAVYNMITCKLMSMADGAAVFILFNGLVQNTILIGKIGIVTHYSSNQIPSPTNYGGIKADAVDDARYSVPVKFNSEDGKLYVPEYPSNGTERITKTSSDTNVTIEPNKLYVWPEISSLTITLAAPTNNNIANEYHFFFESGSIPTTLTLNDVLSDAYSIDANMKYEVSILEGIARIKGFAKSES